MDIDAVATELYGLAPADFTNRRNARASEAKSAGDRELARAIGKLGRPSISAWLANVLVRERGGQVQSMLDLGAAIRKAQAELAKDELRQLQRERRRAVAALLYEAGALARDRNESVSGAVVRELEATLEAALLDPEAATALRAGLLTTGLHYAGLGWSEAPHDRPHAVGTSAPAALVGGSEKSDAGVPRADEALRLAAAEIQHQRESQLAEAEREADERNREVEAAARDRDVWRLKATDLEQQLGYAQQEERKAEHRVADAEEALALAKERLRAARVRVAETNSDLSG